MMKLGWSAIIFIFMIGCRETHNTPKPRAYPRIEYPSREFTAYNAAECPFTFEYPTYAEINPKEEKCWFDLFMPVFDARIHCSYARITDRQHFDDLVKDAFTIASKINERANYMEESLLVNKNNIHGLALTWTGPAASPIHFFMSDTTTHFFKASLYFDSKVKPDSLAPIVTFIREDIDHMIATFDWTGK